MNSFFYAVLFLTVLTAATAITIYFALKKESNKNRYSKYVLNKFEPDNTAPKITELIEFHKRNKTSNYKMNEEA